MVRSLNCRSLSRSANPPLGIPKWIESRVGPGLTVILSTFSQHIYKVSHHLFLSHFIIIKLLEWHSPGLVVVWQHWDYFLKSEFLASKKILEISEVARGSRSPKGRPEELIVATTGHEGLSKAHQKFGWCFTRQREITTTPCVNMSTRHTSLSKC